MTATQPPQHLRRVVLVGASVRAAAESARRAGYRVIGIDLFGDTDTRAACEHFFQLSKTKDGENEQILQCCAGLPLLTVGGLQGIHPWLDRLHAVCHPIGPSRQVCSALRDPRQLANLAAQADFAVPPIAAPPTEGPPTEGPPTEGRCPPHLPGTRWLVKQADSSGGFGVRWWSDTEHPSGAVIQQWIEGRNYGATFLSDGHRALLLGVCRSLFTRQAPLPFIYAGSFGPVKPSAATTARLQRLGLATVRETGISGLFNADVVIDRGGQLWLLEINPRWSGSSEVIERSMIEHRFPENVTESLLGRVLAVADQPWPAVTNRDRSFPLDSHTFLKRIIFARHELRWQPSRLADPIGPWHSFHDLPADGTIIRRGEPILTLLTKLPPRIRPADVLRSHRNLHQQVVTTSLLA